MFPWGNALKNRCKLVNSANVKKKIVPIIAVFVVFVLVLSVVLNSYLRRSHLLNHSLFLTDGVNTELLFGKPPKTVIASLLEVWKLQQSYQEIKIDYPFDKSIFPPEIVAPTFLWHDPNSKADLWLVDIVFTDNPNHIYALTSGKRPEPVIESQSIAESNKHWCPSEYDRTAKGWTADERAWGIIKHNSIEKLATVTIVGFDSRNISGFLSKGVVKVLTSKDVVGAPVFFRDVPLMPSKTKKGVIEPIAKEAQILIRWKLRDISKPQAATVLENMPTCANCHTFSADGKVLGMDLDGPSGDKGAYAFTAVKKKIVITEDDIITWNSFKPKDPPGHKSFGLFSSVSPDGKYVVSTVNESVFVSNYENFEFLQSFYPTRGILALYSKETGAMRALPGANDPNYVQTNACWSPDGKYLVFSRAPTKKTYESEERPKYSGDPRETFIQYDLYRMPFNNGKGGEPEPIRGASNNGMSNSFAKYSPDGKWIVFVKSQKGQLMRPDSKLYIIPAENGEARELKSNLQLMNSWHSWSPNSRWLVFSSKGFSPFTQMFLTHIDENGDASPPILIPNSTAANRAVNIPEFVNNRADAITSISAPMQEANRHLVIGDKFLKVGKYAEAVKEYEEAVRINPYSDRAYNNFGAVLAAMGRTDDAIAQYKKALEINNEDAMIYCNLGFELIGRNKLQEALLQFIEAERIDPCYGDTYLGRAVVLDRQEKRPEALSYFRKAYNLNYDKAKVAEFMVPSLIRYGDILRKQGKDELARECYREAAEVKTLK